MTKIILLTHGKETIVDDEDFEYLNKYKWYINEHGYAVRTVWKHGRVRIHREIMKTPKGMFTDHINGNKLDNRKCNLRTCNHSQNAANAKIYKTNKSNAKGVSWHKESKKWRATIMVSYHSIHLGLFNTVKDASFAYQNAAKNYFGTFYNLG